MKVCTFIFSCCFFASPDMQSQPNWVWQNPLPQGNHLNSVCFTDSMRGVAVGDFGTILTTTDGGVTWVQQQRVTTHRLTSVSMGTSDRGVVVGDSGTILRTSDGGSIWILRPGAGTTNLFGVDFTNETLSMAVGESGTVLKSSNGGMDWLTIPIGVTNTMTGVAYIDSVTATVVGKTSIILRTTDGGDSWQPQTGEGFGYAAVSFLDRMRGVICGYEDIVLGTTDGGDHWVRQQLAENFGSDYFWTVALADSLHGTVATASDFNWLYRTTNGGVFWDLQSYGTYDNIHGLHYQNGRIGTAVGKAGRIMRSTDIGATWKSQSTGVSFPLRGVSFSDALNGSAIGFSTIMHTTDGGMTWVNQSNRTTGLSVENMLLLDVDMVDANNGVIVGESGVVIRTTNGGDDWLGQANLANNAPFYAVSMQGPVTGIVVGGQGEAVIYQTMDRGVTWLNRSPGIAAPLFDVSFPTNVVGTAVGQGVIMRATDGGMNWAPQSSPSPYSLYGVSFATADTGIAVGLYGTIIRTTNGGGTWLQSSSGTPEDLYDVAMADARNAIAIGGKGTVLVTTNGGETWTPGPRETDHFLWAISCLDTGTVTIVGDHGTILGTKNPGTLTIPPPPTLAYPPDGTTDLTTTPDFKWKGSGNASSYRLQVTRDSTFVTLDFDVSNIMALHKELIDLDRDTLHYWRVSGANVLGEGSFSVPWKFRTTPLVPDVPRLLAPPDSATGLYTPVMMSWDIVAGWLAFELQIAYDSTFTEVIIGGSRSAFTGTWLVGVVPDTTYFWRVRAFTNIGASAFSKAWRFRTLALPDPPQLISPSDAAVVTSSRVVFDWSDVPATTNYQLEVSNDPGFTDLFWWNTMVPSMMEVGGFLPQKAYYWRVRSWNNAGPSSFTAPRSLVTNFPSSVEWIDAAVPREYYLWQNYPNPFNPSTTIEFSVREVGHTAVIVYNMLGEKVDAIVDQELPAGTYRIQWIPESLPSGVYFCRLQSGKFAQTRKVMLVR